MQQNPSLRTNGSYRSKRSRYASRACKECQRRKVRCDGALPCARCVGQSIQCRYNTQANNAVHHRIEDANRRCSPEEDHQRDESTERANDCTTSPDFCGPSSTEFTFNAVSGNLRAMGLGPGIVAKSSSLESSANLSSRLIQYGPLLRLITMDPMWDIRQEDAERMIDDWSYGLGAIYPIVSRNTIWATACEVCTTLRSVQSDDHMRAQIAAEALFNQNTNKLKVILAIGLTKAAGGRDQQAERLLQSISEAVESLLWDSQGIHGIQLLFLVGMYYYHLYDEVKTGRCVALAARLCLEKGLHRYAMVTRSLKKSEQEEALRTFWAVYMFERRLGLGSGIPFSIQDSHIDPKLLEMSKSAVLTALLQWTSIAGKTWHTLNSQGEKSPISKIDDLDYLDYQVQLWYDNLPADLKMSSGPTSYPQSVLYVRRAHLRVLIYRPLLNEPSYFRRHENAFRKGIEIAKETIRALCDLNEKTELVQSQPMFFQQLLLTAFGNLLLAVVNASKTIWSSVRTEFDQALNLFRFLSSRTAALRRTWERLQVLRDLPKKLNTPNSGNGIHASGQIQLRERPVEESQTSLSFAAIFPEFEETRNNVSDSLDIEEQSLDAEWQVSDQFRKNFDDMFALDNFFDFPFHDLDGSTYVT